MAAQQTFSAAPSVCSENSSESRPLTALPSSLGDASGGSNRQMITTFGRPSSLRPAVILSTGSLTSSRRFSKASSVSCSTSARFFL